MKLKAKLFRINTGGNFVVALNQKMIKHFAIAHGDRLRLMSARKYIVATINLAENLKDNEIGIFSEVEKELEIDEGELITVVPEERPKSILAIKKKMDNIELCDDEIKDLITDIVDNKLTQAEIAAFVCAAYINDFSTHETAMMAKAMAETGEMIHVKGKPILDKHCAGGVPGNRTTMLVVPIVTSAGLIMPKTSSRSITDPAGTADVMEVLAGVNFDAVEIEKMVEKIGGCIVWGGGVNIAPADDIIIKIEQPLGIDPTAMLLSSILAKKFAAGATLALIDLPFGPGSKMNKKKADGLEKMFIKIGKELGITIRVVKTDGTKPIGRGMGAILEARDVLMVLENSKNAPKDLREKAIHMAGILLEMGGKAKKGHGSKLAEKILKSGKAHSQMMRIISEQGGNPKVKSADLSPGKVSDHIFAHKSGKITEVKNHEIQFLAKVLGGPYEKGAGLDLHCNVGNKVKTGEKICTLYSESQRKMEDALEAIAHHNPFVIGQTNRKNKKSQRKITIKKTKKKPKKRK